MIAVARDYEGLRIAALDLFEEARLSRQQERQLAKLDQAANRDELLDSMARKRAVSEGYYARVEYLLELERMMEMGLQFKSGDLQVKELRGLEVVAAARGEFGRKYAACGRCGFPNIKLAPRCAECGVELQAKVKR